MNKYKHLLYYLTITALLFWSIGCDEDETVESPPPTGLEILEVTQTLLANIDSIYTFRVRVADEGVNPDYVLCTVSGPSGTNPGTFNLYDDGGLNELEAHPYAQSPSGDIVPNNDTYTRNVNSRLLTNEVAGDYTFSFSVPGQSNPLYTETRTVTAADIEQCIIADAPTLNGMDSCFTPLDISVTLTRTAPDVIDSVWLVLGDEYEVFLNPSTVDTIWTAAIAPNHFPCLASGDYSLEYLAKTHFGMSCSFDAGTVSFINDAQEIANLAGLPDTLYRPTAVGDTPMVAIITLDLFDCNLEGVTTFNGVRFDVKVDDGGFGSDSSYVLGNAGVAGDEVAGDATYSVGLKLNKHATLLNNLFTFRFYSIDCAPPYERTGYLYDSVRVIQPLAELDGLIPASDELGFEVITAPARENH